jgi:hypothetical protein
MVGVAKLWVQVSAAPLAYGNGDTGLVNPSLVAGMLECDPFANIIVSNGNYVTFAIESINPVLPEISVQVDVLNLTDGGNITSVFLAEVIN